ncbi:MAG: MFS transporter [Solirubrobacteraceae bacterium]
MGSDSSMSRRRRLLVLAICCMSLLIVGLDTTIVNVALPSIQKDLDAPVSGLQWIIDAYTLVIASLLMLSGSLADRVGRRLVFQIGLVMFTLGSGLCSLAPNLGFLIAFRAVQGIGGSMLNPVAMSIIRNVFEDPKERAQAIGLWGATVGLSLALGPIVGGVLVQNVSWRAIFWINIPIGLSAVALTALFVPESRAARARRIDPGGQALVITLLAALTYAIIAAPSAGWLSGETLGLFGVAALALVVLVRYERRRLEPLLEMRFFRSVPFSGASLIAVSAFAALAGLLFLNTLFLQETRHLSAFDAGLYMLPIAGMTLLCAPLSGRFVGSHGARLPLAVGGIGITAGAVLLTTAAKSTPIWDLLLAYLIFGIGFGAVNPPITNTAVDGMPASQAGVAAAVASTSRQVGSTLGVAVLGAIAATGSIAAVGGHAASFAPSEAGWWIVAGCGVVVFALGLLTTTSRARGSAAEVAKTFDEGGRASPPLPHEPEPAGA